MGNCCNILFHLQLRTQLYARVPRTVLEARGRAFFPESRGERGILTLLHGFENFVPFLLILSAFLIIVFHNATGCKPYD